MPERRLSVGASLRNLVGNRPIIVLLTLSAVLLVIAITVAFLTLSSVSQSNERVEHTLRVQTALNRILALNERIETARRGYLIAPDPAFVNVLQQAQQDLKLQLDQAADLLSDNDVQMQRLAQINALEAQRGAIISESVLTPYTALARAREVGLNKEPGVIIVRRVRALGIQMTESEEALLFARNRQQIKSQQQFYIVGGIASLLLFIMLLTVVLLVLRYNRELSRAQVQLRQANEGLEAAVAARTAELTRANEEIQRFAYIVSHDLRSPLVNVLGFTAELDEARKIIRKYLAEMFERHPALRDQAVWLAADEDLPEALDFIRKSTEKMDRLINSILELSRQGRRPLTPEALDMNVLADGVVASLYQRSEAAGAQIVVEPLPAIQSDRIAVEQILSNLIENALKYLSPKRPGRIEISGRKAGRMVEIAIKDNGRGIDPADHERVFELFRRAGTQDQPGEGIGLANVRALAYRLGGTISLESKLDEGATFTLSLPERFTALDAPQ